jgi:Mg-chelatase subunit ChlD
MSKGGVKDKTLITIVFDMSGSMAKGKKTVVKNVVKSLLVDAALTADKVCFISMHGRFAKRIFDFTATMPEAEAAIEKESFGGTTPLASGIFLGMNTLETSLKKYGDEYEALFVICSDGDSNVPIGIGANIKRELDIKLRTLRNADHINKMFIDISDDGAQEARDLAHKSAAKYFHAGGANDTKIYQFIKSARNRITRRF